jgi:hypothetical protein
VGKKISDATFEELRAGPQESKEVAADRFVLLLSLVVAPGWYSSRAVTTRIGAFGYLQGPASWLQGWLPVTVQLGLSALPGLAPGTVTELSSVEVRGVRTVTAMPVQSLGPIHDDRPMSWTILGLLGGSLRDRPRV